MPTKTDQVKAKLAKKPNPKPEEIKKWAEEIGCSPSLVYKWLRKMPAEARRVVEAGEPVVTVEEEIEEIIEEPAEETFEPPSEFAEETSAEEVVEAEEEVVVEEEAEEEEEQRILRAISKRAIKRLFGVAIEEGLGLGKQLGLTDQEADDTEFLLMIFIAKYAMIEVRENLLEITSGLHFGSLGLKLLVAWIKKRRKEAKEEKEVRKTEEEKKTEEEIAPGASTETVETPTEEEAREDTEAEREKKRKEAEKAYLKKLGGA